MKYIGISIIVGCSVFLFVLLLLGRQKKSVLSSTPNDTWLFSNFLTKLYDALFGDKDPAQISKKLGLEYDKYMINCNIIGKEPDFKKETMMRAIALVLFFASIILSAVLFNIVPFFFGAGTYLLLVSNVTKSAQKAAEAKKSALLLEFPRFIDMLLSALEVGFPIDVAIIQVSDNVPGIISDELKKSVAEMQIGAKSWKDALESIARKYEIDLFSDFVLDVTTAYDKGVSVTESVARKSYVIKQSALLRAKESVAKMSTTILVPIVIFKIVPLLAIMMIPIVIQILTGF